MSKDLLNYINEWNLFDGFIPDLIKNHRSTIENSIKSNTEFDLNDNHIKVILRDTAIDLAETYTLKLKIQFEKEFKQYSDDEYYLGVEPELLNNYISYKEFIEQLESDSIDEIDTITEEDFKKLYCEIVIHRY